MRILRRTPPIHVVWIEGLLGYFLVSSYPIICASVLTISHSYANGPPTIALFGLGLHRFPALVGSLTFAALYVSTVLVFPATLTSNAQLLWDDYSRPP